MSVDQVTFPAMVSQAHWYSRDKESQEVPKANGQHDALSTKVVWSDYRMVELAEMQHFYWIK